MDNNTKSTLLGLLRDALRDNLGDFSTTVAELQPNEQALTWVVKNDNDGTYWVATAMAMGLADGPNRIKWRTDVSYDCAGMEAPEAFEALERRFGIN